MVKKDQPIFLTGFDNRKLKRCKNKDLDIHILLKNLNLTEPHCLLLKPKNQTALLTEKKPKKEKEKSLNSLID
jgi:hypothetical protein